MLFRSIEMNEPQVTLQLTVAQLNIIISGIVKLPIEVGLETFQEVNRQAEQQLGKPTFAPQGPLSNKVVQ